MVLCLTTIVFVLLMIFQETSQVKRIDSQISADYDPYSNDIDKLIQKFVQSSLSQQNLISDSSITNSSIKDEKKNTKKSQKLKKKKLKRFEQQESFENSSLPYKQWVTMFQKSSNQKDDLAYLQQMSPRQGHSAVLYQGNEKYLNLIQGISTDTQFILIFGGIDSEGKRYNDLHAISLPSFKWLDLAQIQSECESSRPTPRAGHSSVVFGDRMYLYGGEDSQGNSNEFFVLDLNNLCWSRLDVAGISPRGRSYHSSTLIPPTNFDLGSHPKWVIFGGYSDKGFLNDLVIFDLVLQRWEKPVTIGTKRDSEPTARQGASMVYALNRLWLFGGYHQGQFYHDIFQLDLASNEWSDITDQIQGELPSNRQLAGIIYQNNHIESAMQGSIYIYGGCDYFTKVCYNDLYQLTLKDQWMKKVELKNEISPREGHQLVSFGSLVLSIGGCDSIKEQCNNDILVMQTLKESDLEKKILKTDSAFCKNKNGMVVYEDDLNFLYCYCEESYQGKDCSIELSCPNDCQGNGICKSGFQCKCYAGFGDEDCSVKLDGCGEQNCTQSDNGGECVKQTESKGQCKCNSNRYGQFCQYDNDPKEVSVNIVNSQQAENNDVTVDDLIIQKYKKALTQSSSFFGFMEPQNFLQSNRIQTNNSNWKSAQVDEVDFIFKESNSSMGNVLQDCENECSNNGVCRNYICYCEPEFTDKTCRTSIAEFSSIGTPWHEAVFYLYGAISIGVISGIILIRYFLQKNREKEYMKFN
ncbi:kelch motif family [Stylonychia lemnae]|uniref:Kelch motif family n=1 Tax=Stylonychia lemnae TaxID=5949 RepID=A0A078AZ88_STYLE|nr:kelch motif family [Stylonychia lemnae]|eukprot:CDW87459.1 kelch motif family [Stylonychia lemnae]